LDEKNIKSVSEAFGIALPTAKKYVRMSEKQLNGLDMPTNYKKRDTAMNDWLNIIFKMMDEGHSNETIYFYVLRQSDYQEGRQKLEKYIYLIGKNNFPDRIPFNAKYLIEWVYPREVTVIGRNDLLKYLLTCNPKAKKDETIGQYIDMLIEKYPAARRVEETFKEFHSIIMGSDPDKLDGFLEKYGDSEISSFCNGIKKDIAPVKNAISFSVSSGFVEGNNNKFKLLKRIVYGRSGLANLAKKCKLAFMPRGNEFRLDSLL
jgi:hypothetical protein